ncbi:MAG: hypothetical protein R2759_04690 [Bacteroidales bacterium]
MDSTYVNEYPIPNAEITGNDMVCEGDTIWLTTQAGNFDIYWNGEASESTTSW